VVKLFTAAVFAARSRGFSSLIQLGSGVGDNKENEK
jgi:hypothetical protein